MKYLLFVLLPSLSFNYCLAQSSNPYTLKEYINSFKLQTVVDVQTEMNVLTISGYKTSKDKYLTSRKVKLKRDEVYANSNWSYFLNLDHYQKLPLSITTVPFKVRPSFDEFETNASSGITNLGLNLDLGRWQMDRYFSFGKKSTHKFYAGLWVAPSVEELNSTQTRGVLSEGETDKQLFISTALTINYTYNNITFTFVPEGFDIATSTIGEEWVYNKRRWWGFGIGLEPKFLTFLSTN